MLVVAVDYKNRLKFGYIWKLELMEFSDWLDKQVKERSQAQSLVLDT